MTRLAAARAQHYDFMTIEVASKSKREVVVSSSGVREELRRWLPSVRR